MRLDVFLFILLLLIAGVIFLQIFLSKRESRWPGLILPGICVLISIFGVLAIATFSVAHLTGSANLGEVTIIDAYEYGMDIKGEGFAFLGTAAIVFLLYNIPTIVLLAIYFACREKRKRKKELDKMSAQDLE